SPGTSSGSSTKRNSASGSRNRLMSQAHPARSTWQPRRVAHLIARPPLPRRAPRPPARLAGARRHRTNRARGSRVTCGLGAQPSARPRPRRRILPPGLLRRREDGRVFLCHALRAALGEITLLRAGSRLRKPERRLTARFADLVCEPLEALLVLRRARQGDEPV